MTVPHVGNTGVNTEDLESDRPRDPAAFIVREVSPVVSNWRQRVPDYLRRRHPASARSTRTPRRLLR